MSDQQAAKLCTYKLGSPSPQAADCGLKSGDLLIAVNGQPFDNEGPSPDERLRGTRGAALLTYLRGDDKRMVLTRATALGSVTPGPAPSEADSESARLNPAVYRNWQVMAHDDGTYDIHTAEPSLLALVLAPVWLIQTRLWVPLALWAGISIAVVPTGLTGVIMVQLAMALYFWQAAPALFRTDRRGQSMHLVGIFAERNEAALHRRLSAMDSKFRYVFAPANSEGDKPSEPV
ncbi:hypothetical protein [Pseudoprimorskyibacter insulae]|uniref:PDZ domain-containing protein n=1 Tax=Pseudoprimorskyibacter insulae TaxID=1695997 RepID=A0A2R8AVZ7_9RHOB|nr:hypothetical protein [Pseudoprimorskyibacter insulae]SPF80097.1 hypothetical protein PRI8871_01899 [Pseudoprimorskyibacter insulae]